MIEGTAEPGFEEVREAFASVFDDLGEAGAAVAVWHEGRLVVDLAGGGLGRDALVHAYSVVKPFAAVATLAAGLDPDGRVDDVWPRLEGATLRHLLAHQGGLPAFRGPVDLTDWAATCRVLAETEPFWAPGTAHGEHAKTYGHLLGEVVRRRTGRTLGAVLREDVCGPLELDLFVGLRPAEAARAADLVALPGWPDALLAGAGDLLRQAVTVPSGSLQPAVVNGARWRAAEIPAVNGHASARAVAGFYAALLQDGAGVLDPGIVGAACAPAASGPDLVLGRDVTWGLGPQVDGAEVGLGGIGGSLGFCNVEAGFAFGYVTRALGTHDRAGRVADAVESALGVRRPSA